jgi:hypothetical protein
LAGLSQADSAHALKDFVDGMLDCLFEALRASAAERGVPFTTVLDDFELVVEGQADRAPSLTTSRFREAFGSDQ